MTRPMFALAGALAVGLLLTAVSCSRTETPPTPKPAPAATQEAGQPWAVGLPDGALKGLKVGFSQMGSESDWRVAETRSIREEAQRLGVELKFSNAEGDQAKQITALNSFINQGVDAIILAPKVETGWEPTLKKIRQKKIPVILVDRGIKVDDPTLYTTLIASDFIEEGRLAARWLAEKAGGKAKIIQLEGTPGSDPANDRAAGFKEVIDEHPEMKIIASQTGDFKQEEGKKVMEAMLKAPYAGEITAVYAHNDNMALGAIQAIEEAGKKPGKDILVVSIDAVKGAFDAMVAGKLNCTVECTPLLGPAAFQAVQQVRGGKALPRKTVVKDEVFGQSVAKDIIGTRKY